MGQARPHVGRDASTIADAVPVGALPDWLHHYNHHRPHTATQGHPPITRLTNLPDQYT